MLEWDFGIATYSEYDADGFLGVQIDVYGEERSGCAPLEVHAPFGFGSRPLDPAEGGLGCHALWAWEGSHGHVWLAGDPRITAKLPKLTKGGSIQYCAAGAYALFDGETGDFTVHVPAGASITLACEGGPKVTVSSTGLAIGGPGAGPVALAQPLLTYLNVLDLWTTAVSKILQAMGLAIEPPKATGAMASTRTSSE
jgi:hypothetical protein